MRAVVFTNPNYYGISPRVDLLVALIHDYDKIAIIDEAHGAHLPFHDDLPLSGLEVGADLVISGLIRLACYDADIASTSHRRQGAG